MRYDCIVPFPYIVDNTGVHIKVKVKGKVVDSGRRKLGVIMGDDVHTGINTSINIGVMIEKGKSTNPGEIVKS